MLYEYKKEPSVSGSYLIRITHSGLLTSWVGVYLPPLLNRGARDEDDYYDDAEGYADHTKSDKDSTAILRSFLGNCQL